MVTFFKGRNFGSILQATALSTFLSGQRYPVYVIEHFRVWGFILKHPAMLWCKLYNKATVKSRIKLIGTNPRVMPDDQRKRLNQFEKDNLNVISITDEKKWRQIQAEDSVFITGSDLTWHPRYGYPGKFFLDFAYYAKKKRIAYAASIGTFNLEKKFKSAYRRYLGSYSAIGVREKDSISILKPYTDTKTKWVVDPTLLLTAEQWDSLCEKAIVPARVVPGKFVFCYFVMDDPKYWNYVEKISKRTGLEIVVLPMSAGDDERPYTVISNGTPYEFIWLIKNAKFICTDSYHACMFSIIYKNDFYLIRRTRKEEDSKYNGFLDRYDLQSRVVDGLEEFKEKNRTDYSKMKDKLEYDRKESIRFLLEEIEN